MRNRLARQLGGDLILLAPQTLETVAPDPTLLRPNRNSDIAEQSEADESEEKKGMERDVLRNLERLSEGNEIRIFDADKERTQRFRPRTLPDDFLNSERTRDENASYTKKRAFQNTEPSVSPISKPYSKRIRRETANLSAYHQYGMQSEPSQRQSLHPSLDDQSSASHGRDHDVHRSYIRTHRIKTDSPAPPRNKTHALRFSRLQQSSPANKKKEHGLRDHSESRRRTVSREFLFDSSSLPLCHSVSPAKRFDTMSSRVRSSKHRGRTGSVGSNDLARGMTPPSAKEEERWPHHFRPFLTEECALRERPLVPSTRGLNPINTLKRFPPVDIDSDSEPVSNREHSARPEYDSFRCILSKESFQLGQISAEVLRIEHELLNDPDQDVRIFSHPYQRQQDKRMGVCRYPDLNANLAEANKNQTSIVLEKENMIPKPSAPTLKKGIASTDGPPRKSILEQDLDVTPSLSQKNPVTEAGTTERINSTKFSENFETM